MMMVIDVLATLLSLVSVTNAIELSLPPPPAAPGMKDTSVPAINGNFCLDADSVGSCSLLVTVTMSSGSVVGRYADGLAQDSILFETTILNGGRGAVGYWQLYKSRSPTEVCWATDATLAFIDDNQFVFTAKPHTGDDICTKYFGGSGLFVRQLKD